MQRTRVKICGLTRVPDVQQACDLGADAVGFVCYPASRRFVEPARLAQLARAVSPLVTPVLLFVDATAAQVQHALEVVPNALLQFHGREDALACQCFGRPYLRAVAIGEGTDLLEFERAFEGASGLLADAPSAQFGGAGRTFDWQRLPAPAQRTLPLILAGGLDAENVMAAIAAVRPHAVDVSSGVEETHGVKSVARMRSFIAAVRRADARIGAA
ncbi:N-(5'-phosphoribosyl)anthranilate isomerase [Burkholderiales bacterium]|nr:N-(5'-phosphoribosyl)anthranilate isomerase [Burkholderiales bacterium]